MIESDAGVSATFLGKRSRSNRRIDAKTLPEPLFLAHYIFMFVRWKQDKSQARDPYHRARKDNAACLKAILVESVRIDGKPRQKHITFLGSIHRDLVNRHDTSSGSRWKTASGSRPRLPRGCRRSSRKRKRHGSVKERKWHQCSACNACFALPWRW